VYGSAVPRSIGPIRRICLGFGEVVNKTRELSPAVRGGVNEVPER
jgi:hypothetical protein